jgi:hypothetical protein
VSRVKVKSSLDVLMEFGEAHPDAMARAQAVVSDWGKSGKQLQHCIAEALLDVAQNGLQSIAKAPAPLRMTRSAPAPAPVRPQRTIRGAR